MKHGLKKHPLYDTWKSIRRRCTDPRYREYQYYGGRGIKMLPLWAKHPLSFINYASDLENAYSEGLTIDRIDNDKGYFPGNLRWATKSEQVLNRGIQKNNKTGYVGVCFTQGAYKSTIKVFRKSVHLGTFESAIKAAQARDNYIIENKLKGYKLQVLTPQKL